MLQWLRSRSHIRRKAGEIYGAVVAAARQPAFYRQYRVPDTPEGRFEMVALVLFLVMERVKRVAPDGAALTQGAIEAFVTDMDDCMREMGVGDLTVSKKVKRAAAAFYERAGYYRGHLGSGDATDASTNGLAADLARFVFAGQPGGHVEALTRYVQGVSRRLKRARDGDLDGGGLDGILLEQEEKQAI
jgi:cytochrome b pre-mRNA-processing protein 3